MRIFIVLALLITSITSHAAEELDCRRAQVAVNLDEQTNKEGLLSVFHLLSQAHAKSVIFEYDRLNPTEEPPRIVRFYFLDVFPSATPEYKEIYRNSMNELGAKLADIPGVAVECSKKPADPSSPRISGGFGQ